jgi:hypothetical protein
MKINFAEEFMPFNDLLSKSRHYRAEAWLAIAFGDPLGPNTNVSGFPSYQA